MGPCSPRQQKALTPRVSYHGQKPHCQSKCPKALLCFKFNFKNAVKKALPSFGDANCPKRCRRRKMRIEHLIDGLSFDLNKLLIYEIQREPSKFPSLNWDSQIEKSIQKLPRQEPDCSDLVCHLRTIKIKADEVKTMAMRNSCLHQTDLMLRIRGRIKCSLECLRKQLIEFMTNVEMTDRRKTAACQILQELAMIEHDLTCLCRSVPIKLEPIDCKSVEDSCPANDGRGDAELSQCQEEPAVFQVPTDNNSNDSLSIHLRYVPELRAVKANMASHPCAFRLPLMCPSMRRIMNKMRPSYLLDDVPVVKDDNSTE